MDSNDINSKKYLDFEENIDNNKNNRKNLLKS